MSALNGLVPANDSSLVNRMIALHAAYLANKSHLLWFGNLVSCVPDILKVMKCKASPEQLVSILYLYIHHLTFTHIIIFCELKDILRRSNDMMKFTSSKDIL